MRVIIAGSRDIIDPLIVEDAVSEFKKKSEQEITEVLSGCARGVDTLGEEWARKNNINIKFMPANWEKYGRSAGYKRNVAMAGKADALIAVWDGKSRGTGHMIDIAREYHLHTYVHIPTLVEGPEFGDGPEFEGWEERSHDAEHHY